MEPVTHFLTGAVLARAGLNRRALYATAAMTLAAEFPDIDILWSAAGPVTGFEHHRGITHTFLGIPVEAALLTAGFYLYHRLRQRPVTGRAQWLWLYAGTLLALLSHLLLDWTNNYGLRPFFPFNPRWYAGSFVFIFEPLLFLFLLLALLGPALFGLINAEVGVQRTHFRGRPSALAALAAIAALYLFRFQEHALALDQARLNTPTATRVFASPHPLNPFTWHIVTDNPDSYQLATLDTRTGLFAAPEPADTLYKPVASLPILAAKRTYLGEIYLDWSTYPVIAESPDHSDPDHPLTLVTFSDARFLYNASLLHGRPGSGQPPPLSATVLLDMAAPEFERVVETRMGNRLQQADQRTPASRTR